VDNWGRKQWQTIEWITAALAVMILIFGAPQVDDGSLRPLVWTLGCALAVVAAYAEIRANRLKGRQ
jgi:hypothetical protein